MAANAKPMQIEPNGGIGQKHNALANAQNLRLSPVVDGIETPDGTPQSVYLLRFVAILLKWRWAVCAGWITRRSVSSGRHSGRSLSSPSPVVI